MKLSRSTYLSAATLAIGALALTACGSSPSASSSTATASAVASDSTSASPSMEASTDASGATTYPIEITSCGFTSTITAEPTHAVTMNQGATEVMLALGLEADLAGTAYLDDAVASKYENAYKSVPVLSDEYPDKETLLAAKPDFIYASYVSAFDNEAAGPQQHWQDAGVGTYTSPFGCGKAGPVAEVSFDTVWSEVYTIGEVFDVPDRAAALETEQQGILDAAASTNAGDGLTVFWYDSGDKTPTVGAGHGSPQLVIDSVGGTNIFADLPGGWTEASWEKVVAANPDLIVLGDASWSTAADKIKYLESDPVLKDLDAVKNKKYVTLPFSETTAGARLADGVQSMSDQLVKLNAQ